MTDSNPPNDTPKKRTNRLYGCLIGCAVGDSIGLPSEGLPRKRIARWWPEPLRHRFLFDHGMLSDDTEQSLIVAKALFQHPLDLDAFVAQVAGDLRWWLLGLPAGIGLATARAIVKLWLGVRPQSSGVKSAGNGAAMRSAIIGAYFSRSPTALKKFVKASTEITHSDSRAYTGALAVAQLAAWIANHSFGERPDSDELAQLLSGCGQDTEWHQITMTLFESAEANDSVDDVAKTLQLYPAVSGYVYHTVPIAIFSFWRHAGDFRSGIESAIRCGGDTDTIAAITGSLLGIGCPVNSIPSSWINRLRDWPRSRQYIEAIAELGEGTNSNGVNATVPRLNPLGLLVRNIIFLMTVLAHGLRRLFPPY